MNKTRLFTIISVTFLLFTIGEQKANSQTTLELNVGLGYTMTNIDAWSWGNADEWGQFMGDINAMIFPFQFGKISVGAELGYQYFLWYSYKATGYIYDYWVDVEYDAYKALAIIRVDIGNNIFIEGGAGAYKFGDFTDLGISSSLGYMINADKKLSFPIKIKTGVIFDEDTSLFPMGISIGVSYN